MQQKDVVLQQGGQERMMNCGIIGGIMGIILWVEYDIGFRGGLFCVVGIGWLGSVIGYGIGWVIDKLFYN